MTTRSSKKRIKHEYADMENCVIVGANVFFDEEVEESEKIEGTSKNEIHENNKEEKDNSKENRLVENAQKPSSILEELTKRWRVRQQFLQEKGEEILLEQIEKEGVFTRKEVLNFQKEFKLPDVILNDPELSEEDKNKIAKNLKEQREHFKHFTKRDRRLKILSVKIVHPYLTNEEIVQALYFMKSDDNCEGNEEEAVIKLTDLKYLHRVRKRIAEEAMEIEEPQGVKTIIHSNIHPKATLREASDDDGEWGSRRRKKTKKKVKKDQKKKPKKCIKRLRLDEALSQPDMRDWSEARIRAYKAIKTNPNAYYYRFNDPGEKQRNGPWTEEEKAIFLKRLKEFDIHASGTPQWGLFAKGIPGRVGYQCSAFYRQLIKCGEIQDPNYFIDEKGNVHCKYGKGCRKRKKGEITTTSKKGKTRKRRRADDDDVIYASDVDSSEDEEMTPSKMRAMQDRVSGSTRFENPIPGFIDGITQEEVDQPAISPYGHVLGYATWLKILNQEPKNVCPFTKQTLHKRDLVRLTFDNIEQYRNLIKS